MLLLIIDIIILQKQLQVEDVTDEPNDQTDARPHAEVRTQMIIYVWQLYSSCLISPSLHANAKYTMLFVQTTLSDVFFHSLIYLSLFVFLFISASNATEHCTTGWSPA